MEKQKEIESQIFKLVPSLPVNQKRVANFFLEHLDSIALLPIKKIAQKAEVSEASIVRFAQLLGYKGLKELKSELSITLRNQITPTQRFQHAVTEKEKTPDVLNLVAQNVINNIYDTIESIDVQEFSDVVNSIINADQIYSIGMELSHHFAHLMTFLLRSYAYKAHHISIEFLHFYEQIAHLSSKDLLIAFSFSPYSRETVEAVAFAKKRNIKTIAFTDKKIAPVRQYATHCIQIKTDNITFTNSLGAIAVVLNAIITELNFRDKKRTLKALKVIEDTIARKRYFITK